MQLLRCWKELATSARGGVGRGMLTRGAQVVSEIDDLEAWREHFGKKEMEESSKYFSMVRSEQ